MKKYLILFTILLFSHDAFACKCVNRDIHELFDEADLVALVTPRSQDNNDQQWLYINKMIKGQAPKTRIYLESKAEASRNIKLRCRTAQATKKVDNTYLAFFNKDGEQYTEVQSCYNYYPDKMGLVNLRVGNEYANIHSTMLPSFFSRKGKKPKISIRISANASDNKINNWITINNLEDKKIEIFSPSNRQAFIFFVTNNYGNIIQPTGFAKVNPKGGVLTIDAKGVYNYKVNPASKFYFPYLSGTAMFGYNLEKGKTYKVHAIYRPFGGTYSAVYSKETEVVF